MTRTALVLCFLVAELAGQTPAAPDGKRLGLQEAIQTALQNNLQVGIAQATLDSTRAGIQVNQGTFDWNLAANASMGRYDTASASPLYTGSPIYQMDSTSSSKQFSADLNKAFAWGGSFDINYSPVYSYTNTVIINGLLSPTGQVLGNYDYTSPAPWTAGLTATYTQNLLQGFGREMATANLVVARRNAEAADFNFQLSIINLIAATESQYWDLVYAARFLDNKEATLRLAQKQLEDTRILLQNGSIAPLDLVSAQAQVAQAKQDLIAARAQRANAQDALGRALYPNGPRPAGLVPTDTPDLAHSGLDEDAAVAQALDRRVELKAQRVNRDISSLQAKVAADRTRPQLSAFASYNGATENHMAIGPVNGDLTGLKYPGYTVGLKFAVPLQNNAAKGALGQARANLRGSELTLKDAEQSVTLQVRTAVRNVLAAEEGVKAAQETSYYQRKNLEAEQIKFANGKSTNFIVLQVLTNLDNARNAELQSQINYAKAVTALEQAVGNLPQARHLTIQ